MQVCPFLDLLARGGLASHEVCRAQEVNILAKVEAYDKERGTYCLFPSLSAT